MSDRQWQLLAACSYGIYATGQEFPNRPSHVLGDTLLTISFETSIEFSDFCRRAFRIKASRLIAFTVQDAGEKRVLCKAIFNHTPILEVIGTITDPDGDEDDVSIFSIRPQSRPVIRI